MTIGVAEQNGFLEIRLEGRFVASCVEELRAVVEPRLETVHNILFDLKKMTHIDSSGLGTLVQILQRTRALGGTTRLACLQPHPKIVFDITKVFRVFEIFDTVKEARAAFAPPAKKSPRGNKS